MRVRHVEVLTEELSMEAFLEVLLPRLLPADTTFDIHSFQGKAGSAEEPGKPPARLRAMVAQGVPDCRGGRSR